MVDTKSLDLSMQKWKDAQGRVPQAYKDGILAAKDTIAKGVAAEQAYAEGVQASIASGKRARKLQEVSEADWQKAAIEKGAARIGPGMAAAEAKMNTGLGKVLAVIQGVTLAPRTTDPMQNIDNRVKPIAAALHKMAE